MRLSTLTAGLLTVLGVNAASAVIDLIPDNFEKIVTKGGKPALVEFFAPWCGREYTFPAPGVQFSALQR